MKIERIDSDRKVDKEVEKIMINIDGHRYTLTEGHGLLHIHAHRDRLVIMPGCANEVLMDTVDT